MFSPKRNSPRRKHDVTQILTFSVRLKWQFYLHPNKVLTLPPNLRDIIYERSLRILGRDSPTYLIGVH